MSWTYPHLETGLETENARRLVEMAEEVGAFIRGDFTLASGKRSNYYFDGKRITLTPEGAYRVGREICSILSGTSVDAVGGVATGAYPMVTAAGLISHIEGKPVPIFIVREVSKEHGTMRKIEGHLDGDSRVAIVEDVLTTAGSVLQAIEVVEAARCRVVKVIALVDRQEGGGTRLKESGYELSAIMKLVH